MKTKGFSGKPPEKAQAESGRTFQRGVRREVRQEARREVRQGANQAANQAAHQVAHQGARREVRQQEITFRGQIWKVVREWSEAIAEAFIILLALYLLLWPVKIKGTSMEDSVNDGDWVLSCRVAAWVSEPETGDIVLFRVKGVKGDMIKRVVGTAGDTLEIKNESVYINGERLIEGYIREDLEGKTEGAFSARVEDGSFFALGDNRRDSVDSRELGQVPVSAVKAKILFKFYPFDEVRAFFLDSKMIKRSVE